MSENEKMKEEEIEIINESEKPELKTEKTKKSDKKNETDDKNDIDELYENFSSFLKKENFVEDINKELPAITTGIKLLDAILGGGIRTGILTQFVGKPGSGKSMLAANIAGSFQKNVEKSIIAYLDSEVAMTKERLANLGLNQPPISPHSDLTIEKVFAILEGMFRFKAEKNIEAPSMLVWDSVANTLSNKEIEAEDLNTVLGLKARVLSFLIPKYLKNLKIHNVSFLVINQLRNKIKIGPMSPSKQMKFLSANDSIPGGNSLLHNSSVLLYLDVKGVATKDKYGFDGIITNVKAIKNKFFSPMISIDIVGNYNTGFSDFWTSYMFLSECKVLKTGAWNYLSSYPNYKFRTRDAYNKYMENPEFRKIFDEEVKNAIQREIIEKYST